ncbi:CPBP family intramembrane metalloprotease [Haloterrigena sp. SYSU A121-1]|uniref:CPBP family intramembrane metalloprotease n=1 Tax=Haloterrigena gelatinilytica TaxID=2741724 RepID=A0A8J8GKQ0_9EURY|nr:CPBP family intramembrane glutamic endopeptidase [Haloterrigena gelatinilytica]NUB90097.1 CPBP family intramembrane metalloprotease [Haloterrigena gelatinilytica]
MTDRRPPLVFLGSLAALSAGVVALSRLTGVSMVVLAPLYMFTPMLAGIATCLVGPPSFERAGLRVGWGRLRWLAVAAVVPIALVLLGTALSLALPGVEFVPDANPLTGEGTDFAQTQGGEPVGPSLPGWPLNLLATIAVAIGVGATLNVIFAFGEEFGWRGAFLTSLSPLGFWGASAVIGLVWGLWHAPIVLEGYNFPNEPVLGVGAMTVACLAMSPVYTYVTLSARSVLAPAIFHGTFNAFATALVVFAQGGSELVVNPVGLIGALAFGIAAVLIALRGAPELTADWAVAGEDAAGSDAEDGDHGGDAGTLESSTGEA